MAVSISARMAESSMVAGVAYMSPLALFCMVPRRILPECVLGRRCTTTAILKGHGSDRVPHHLHDFVDDRARIAHDSALQHSKPNGIWPFSLSFMPKTAHSATS